MFHILKILPDKEALLIDYIKENQEKFYRLAFQYMKNQQDTFDVIQDAIVHSLEKVSSLKNPEYIRTWFYRILVNKCLDHLRVVKRITYTDQIPESCNLPDPSCDRDAVLDLYDAIDKLEPKLKTIVILRFYEDMKLEEISNVTGAHLSTVKARLYKALRLLRVDMQSDALHSIQGSNSF